jgi:Transcriptional regulators of sugar metabolism
MEERAISILLEIKKGISDLTELKNNVSLEKSRFYEIINKLEKRDYIEKDNSTIRFKKTPKAILFKELSSRYDVNTLLHDSNEKILSTLAEAKTIDEIQEQTKLSQNTVYKSISELESIGIIERNNEGKLYLTRLDDKINLFAKILETQEQQKIPDYAEMIYNGSILLLQVPKGKIIQDAELTAFSLFSDYGIEYHTAYDYYVSHQNSDLSLEDILIHSILITKKKEDTNGMIITILFYLKNMDRIDLLRTRKLAREYDIIDVWLDIENFRRNNPIKNTNLFPSNRSEFEEKAVLYNIPRELYTLPEGYPQLFEEITTKLTDSAEIYLFGGENMRIKGLKDRTKDCDIAVRDNYSYNLIIRALEEMGYRHIGPTGLSLDDKRIESSAILVHQYRSRVDIFKETIMKKMHVSNRMIQRADKKIFGDSHKLTLGILSNEDIFLLKSLTYRDGDIEDMRKIIQSGNFNWDIVWDELIEQERDTGDQFSSIFLENIDDLYKVTKIRPHFYRKLVRRAVDEQINRRVRNEIEMNKLLSLLKSKDISERLIRNRINSLEQQKYLRKRSVNGQTLLSPRKANVLRYASSDSKPFQTRLEQFIEEFSDKMGISDKYRQKALNLSKLVSENPNFIGNRSRNLAAGILYTVMKNNRGIRGDISYFARVSEPGLTNMYEKIQKFVVIKS